MDIILDAFARIAKMVDTLRRCGTEIETTLGIVVKSLSELLSDCDNSEYFKGSFILLQAWVKVPTKIIMLFLKEVLLVALHQISNQLTMISCSLK